MDFKKDAFGIEVKHGDIILVADGNYLRPSIFIKFGSTGNINYIYILDKPEKMDRWWKLSSMCRYAQNMSSYVIYQNPPEDIRKKAEKTLECYKTFKSKNK